MTNQTPYKNSQVIFGIQLNSFGPFYGIGHEQSTCSVTQLFNLEGKEFGDSKKYYSITVSYTHLTLPTNREV